MDSHAISRHADIMDSYTFYNMLTESKQICLSHSPPQREGDEVKQRRLGCQSVVDYFRFLKIAAFKPSFHFNKWKLGFSVYYLLTFPELDEKIDRIHVCVLSTKIFPSKLLKLTICILFINRNGKTSCGFQGSCMPLLFLREQQLGVVTPHSLAITLRLPGNLHYRVAKWKELLVIQVFLPTLNSHFKLSFNNGFVLPCHKTTYT